MSYNTENYIKLFESINSLYSESKNKEKLLFHGWHHIKFVHDKAIEFGESINADLEIVASAALVHDLNYIFSDSLDPNGAREFMKKYLIESGYNEDKIKKIIEAVESAHTGARYNLELNNEAQSLSDGDTLFKALPTTPVLFSSKFIAETGYDLEKLADKIVSEQKQLIENDTYFYTSLAKEKYLKWAETNLSLWENLKESLNDKSVIDMLNMARNHKII